MGHPVVDQPAAPKDHHECPALWTASAGYPKTPTGSLRSTPMSSLSHSPAVERGCFSLDSANREKRRTANPGPRRSTARRLPTLPVSSLPRRNTCDKGCPTPASLRGSCASGSLFSGERLGLFFLPG